jgi:hypothetical protein
LDALKVDLSFLSDWKDKVSLVFASKTLWDQFLRGLLTPKVIAFEESSLSSLYLKTLVHTELPGSFQHRGLLTRIAQYATHL